MTSCAGVMARWQELQNKIQDRLHQRKELQSISCSIASLASDLDTLDSIILDDDEDDSSLDEDYELVDMRHQLFEVNDLVLTTSREAKL